MATFDKCIYDMPSFQEGNVADFELELGENFPIDSVSDITFQVKSVRGESLISKKKSSGEITLTGRVLTVPFPASDTKGKPGIHVYEMDFVNLHGSSFATIGGNFIINKEINTL